MPVASEQQKVFFKMFEDEFNKAFSLSQKARNIGLDPEPFVEINSAKDVAARVEGLVGPKGVAEQIRAIMAQIPEREAAVFKLCDEILEGKFDGSCKEKSNLRDWKIEQAVRSGLALFTEGVVSAPIEGISRVKILKNPDSTEYVALYFSGPIRGAGGTGQAFAVLLADYCRTKAGLAPFKATTQEIERNVEEIALYSIKTRGGQYTPSDEEVRHITTACAVRIDGEPTEDYEVALNKNVATIESNRVRGGMALVTGEGICLKATKMVKLSKKAGLDWKWIEKLVKTAKQEATKMEIKPVSKYMDDVVAGRPIFSYPMTPGGFRLRYGRTRMTGIASKAIHPSTMYVLENFIAIGTHVKVERPGKGAVMTPCESIEAPIIKLKTGEVKQVSDPKEALQIVKENLIEKILFLGDLLVTYGDFSKANHPLVASAWCEEWYQKELQAKGVELGIDEIKTMGIGDATKLSMQHEVPLSPKYTLYWHDISKEELIQLARWIQENGEINGKSLKIKSLGKKELLEKILCPHKVTSINEVALDEENSAALLIPLAMHEGLNCEKLVQESNNSEDVIEILSKACGIAIQRKAGIYVGSSMGRPEKAKEREMKPKVHVLFPISELGGKERSIEKAVKNLKTQVEATEDLRTKTNEKTELQLAVKQCPSCGRILPLNKCEACKVRTIQKKQCVGCQTINDFEMEECTKCKSKMLSESGKLIIDLSKYFEKAIKTLQFKPDIVKGVQGLISDAKIPEALEKGFLRAKYDLSVFRDGTCRFDMTEIPLTHIIPAEIGLPIEKARQLGYSKDSNGNELNEVNQIVEMNAQDIVVSNYTAEYFLKLMQFIDDLLVYYYKLPPYYNCNTKEDVIGHLTIAIAPHTSAGILARIIGFTNVKGLLAHPYLHCACRRNCDGDELCIMLLMDGLLNFSRKYLPSSKGGAMDAPIVLTTLLDPKEVDDEAHAMECCSEYPLELYRASLRNANPSEVKVELVASRLGKETQYEKINYTHPAKIIGPGQTAYVEMENMQQKVEMELSLMAKIKAVDLKGAAEKILSSHFFPDMYGNLRKFSRQQFRCVDCGKKFRRIPLIGKCNDCGAKLLLTINKGGIEKYLKISKEMAQKYGMSDYTKQRIELIEKEIASIFEDEKVKQHTLADFF